MALGDSFTQGHPVARGDAYPAVMSMLLRDRGTPANVVAVGMGDSGPDQQLRVFEHDVLPRVTPDVVVWQFYPNDVWDNIVKAVYTIGDNELVPLDVYRNWLYKRQKLYELVPLGSVLKQHSYLFRYLLKAAGLGKTSHVPMQNEREMRRWALEKIRLEIVRMNELGQTYGFRPFYVLVAPQALYLTGLETHEPELVGFVHTYKRLHEVLREQPGFIDARFDEMPSGVNAERIFVGEDRDNVSLGGRHFQERGYRLLAELVVADIFRLLELSEEVIPEHL